MAPSASKQKRLAEKAAKQSAKVKSKGDNDASSTTGSTPAGSTNGSTAATPLTSMSAATSQEDLSAMAKLQIATDRFVPFLRALSALDRECKGKGWMAGIVA